MSHGFPLPDPIATPRLWLVPLCLAEPQAVLDYVNVNREHFAPTDPVFPLHFHTLGYWQEKIATAKCEWEADTAVRFVLRHEPVESSPVIGTVNFSQIFRGPFQACYVGYGIDHRHQSKGLMTDALSVAVEYMFTVRNIHRIMANYMPENVASARVLQKLGFVVEGQAKDYLHIGGRWRDHVLTSKTNAQWIAKNR